MTLLSEQFRSPRTFFKMNFLNTQSLLVLPVRLTVLALVLSDGLRRSQSCHLLWGFWVNDGGVAALQVLGDGCWVTVALLQFTFQEVLVQLGDAVQSLH